MATKNLPDETVFDRLVEIDHLAVTVIVDNETDALSPPCCCCDPKECTGHVTCKYTSESMRLVSDVQAGRMDEMDYHKVCWAGASSLHC